MPVRNAHWYSRNESQAYPLDETADCIDTKGVYLPPNILVDLNLRYPEQYGPYPFVSAVTVTPLLVTLAIQATDGYDPPYAFNPLAVLTVRQPAPEGVQLALTPLLPGVGGWAVLGSGCRDKDHTARLAGPRHGLITRRAARPYRGLPVEGLKRLHAAKLLTGVVRLVGDPPIQVVGEDRDIPGVGTRRVVVFRLAGLDATDGFIQPPETIKASNVFREFAGPCAGRPESQTCGDPQPIEFVNNVPPDCDGTVTIEFKGCASPAKLGDNGIVVDSATSLSRVCVPPFIPAPDGRLPSEYDPYNYIPSPPTTPPPTTTPPPEDSIDIIGELPFTECFAFDSSGDFVVKSGRWQFADSESPEKDDFCVWEPPPGDSLDSIVDPGPDPVSYEAYDTATRNVAVWEGFDLLSVRRKYVTDVQMSAGSRANAALVLNYRAHQTTAGLFVYYMVELDFTAQAFRVSRFNGVSAQTVLQQSVPGIALNSWYRLVAEVRPGPSNGTTSITAVLTGIDDPVTVTIGPLVVSNYYPSTGKPGLATDRAVSRFSFLRIEELP